MFESRARPSPRGDLRLGRPQVAAAAVLGLVTAAAYFAMTAGLFLPEHERKVLPLVKALGKRRLFEARLSGGFSHGPRMNTKRSPALDREWEVLAAAARIRGQEQDLHAGAVASGVLGQYSEAITTLRGLTESGDTGVLVDLSAFLLARAEAEHRPDDVPRALDSATQAVLGAPASAEGHFNRALALESLSLYAGAEAAWKRARELTTDPDWRAEIDRRLGEARRSPIRPEDHAREMWAALEGEDSEPVRRLIDRSVEASRIFFEEELLQGLAGGTTRPTHLARFGEAFLAVTGDRIAHDTSAALRVDPGGKVREALATFGRSRSAHRLTRWRESEQLLSGLTDPRVPVFGWARLWVGVSQRQRGEMGHAGESLRQALTFARRNRQPGLEARALYNLSVIDEVEGRLDPALAQREAALQILESSRDRAGAAHVAQQAALIWSMLGRHSIGWERRLASLSEAWRIPDPNRRLLLINLVGDDCLGQGLRRCAAGLYSEAATQARAFGEASTVADTLLGQAIAVAPDDTAAAAVLLNESRRVVQTIADPTLRSRLEGEALRAEAASGVAAGQPSSDTLHRAITWLVSQGWPGRALPFRIDRAAALERAGDYEEATKEVNAVLNPETPGTGSRVGSHLELTPGLRARAWRRLMSLRLRSRGPAEELLAYAEQGWGGQDSDLRPARTAVHQLVGAARGSKAAVAFLVLDERVLRWTVSDGTVGFAVLPIAARSVKAPSVRIGNDGRLPAATEALGASLLAGVNLEGKERLAVIGEPALLSFPFGILPHGTGRVIDRVAITAATTVRQSISAVARGRTFERPLIVGVNSALSRGLRLTEAEAEARTVAGLLGASATSPDTSDGPRTADRLRHATMFHFSGHALVDPDRPERSRLVMAPIDQRPADLTTDQIARLPLKHLQLAFLSACATSMTVQDAPESIGSLASAFLSAGTQTVIGTSWAVSDVGMHASAASIYRSMRRGQTAGGAVAEQLREALRSGTNIADAAALVVYGPF